MYEAVPAAVPPPIGLEMERIAPGAKSTPLIEELSELIIATSEIAPLISDKNVSLSSRKLATLTRAVSIPSTIV